jgi:hypothetical protein
VTVANLSASPSPILSGHFRRSSQPIALVEWRYGGLFLMPSGILAGSSPFWKSTLFWRTRILLLILSKLTASAVAVASMTHIGIVGMSSIFDLVSLVSRPASSLRDLASFKQRPIIASLQ